MLFEYESSDGVKASDETKNTIKTFLDKYLEFNPELHVRNALRLNEKDPERKPYNREEFQKKFGMLPPPDDTFFRWRYYSEVNYEEIREMVNILFVEKPDIDFAINPFAQFNSEDEATEFKDKHLEELTTDLHVVTNGMWTLLGAFKENRKRMDFYNQNTQILKAIMDQNISDVKLGKELMKKRVVSQKKKNILESGPDAPGLNKYVSGYANIGDKGADRVLTDEERKELALKAGYVEQPDGSFVKPETPVDPSDLIDNGKDIIVDVYTTDGTNFTKSAFLTESVKPDTAQ
jgi:hypothetical protein